MRILNTKQIQALDAHTIAKEPVSSIDLMERASRAFVDWFTLRVEATKRIGVVCGTGNNGGDGMAIARMLHEWGYPVSVWTIAGGASESDDFKTNRNRLPKLVTHREVAEERDAPDFQNCDVLVDAIFGSGLSRPPSGLYARVINNLNKTEAFKIAVDIPSGLMADVHSSGPIVKAHNTISFQLPKLVFMLPESYTFTGEWVLVDIGLDKKFIRDSPSPYYYTRRKDVRQILRRRSKYDHKGDYGHALLIAGSEGKAGASVLAARAALRAGVGLLTVHVPRCAYAVIQTAVPEAMGHIDKDERIFTEPPDLPPYTTVGIGPGLGQEPVTARAIAKVLENFRKPIVIDADALNVLAAHRHLYELIPPGSILTPHPKEFQRLMGLWKDDFERLEMQKQLAVSLKSIVVLKGAHTSVAMPNSEVHFNSTGNPGMATGGTGDVLTGVITGLLAQNYTPDEAAVAGVFLHGLAGDSAVARCGMDSLIASDLIDSLGEAFLKVFR